MFTATAMTAGVAVLALVATLVLPQGAGEPDPVPGAESSSHYVAADGSGDFLTINDALGAAAEGDTILVAPGTYTEYLHIDKDVTLAGNGPREDIVVEFPVGGPSHDLDGTTVSFPVWLEDTDATVRGLTIYAPILGAAVWVSGGAPVLEDLEVRLDRGAYGSFAIGGRSRPIIRDSSWTGIVGPEGDGESPTFEGNTIRDDTLSLAGPGEFVVRGNTFLDGAFVSASDGATGIIDGNDLTDGAIEIDDGSDVLVEGNTLRDSGRYGRAAIFVRGADSKARVVGNTVTDSDTAIHVSVLAEAEVEGNQLDGNRLSISWSSRETGTIAGNTIRGGSHGINIADGTPVIVGNSVQDADLYGLSIEARAHPIVEGNSVCDCGTNVLIADGAAVELGQNEICPGGVETAE